MTARRAAPFEGVVGSGAALLLAAVVATLVANWPDRTTDPNLAWYAVARVRTTGTLLLAGMAGAGIAESRRGEPRARPIEPVVAALLSAPIEALAYFGSAPAASLTWSVAVPLPLAVATFGLSWALATVLRRLRLAWSSPLLLPAAAVGLVMLDVRVGPVLFIPWLLPFAPSWPAAVLLAGASVVTVAAFLRFLARPGGAK